MAMKTAQITCTLLVLAGLTLVGITQLSGVEPKPAKTVVAAAPTKGTPEKGASERKVVAPHVEMVLASHRS